MINIRRSLTIGLLTFAGLGLGSGPVMADNGIEGGGKTDPNVTITDTDLWTTLQFETFTLSTTSNCVAMASSDVRNPNGSPTDQYGFALALDTTAPAKDDQSERTLELHNADGTEDPDVDAVDSTRFFFSVPPGTHNVFWLGRKITADASTANAVVLDSTLNLICSSTAI